MYCDSARDIAHSIRAKSAITVLLNSGAMFAGAISSCVFNTSGFIRGDCLNVFEGR